MTYLWKGNKMLSTFAIPFPHSQYAFLNVPFPIRAAEACAISLTRQSNDRPYIMDE